VLLWGGMLGVLVALVGQGVLGSMHAQTKIHMVHIYIYIYTVFIYYTWVHSI
jgi:hypothetical protein